MTENEKKRLSDLLRRLDSLDQIRPPAADRKLREMVRDAIQSEISRLACDPWLSVYRNG